MRLTVTNVYPAFQKKSEQEIGASCTVYADVLEEYMLGAIKERLSEFQKLSCLSDTGKEQTNMTKKIRLTQIEEEIVTANVTDTEGRLKHSILREIFLLQSSRFGEACGLAWQDINLGEQCLTVRRSMRYNAIRHKMKIGATKRKKIRTVDFCDTLAEILKKVRKQQHRERFQCGEMYFRNYYQKVTVKGRTYYDLYSLQSTEEIPKDYKELSFVCLRQDGSYESTATLSNVYRLIQKHIEGLEN